MVPVGRYIYMYIHIHHLLGVALGGVDHALLQMPLDGAQVHRVLCLLSVDGDWDKNLGMWVSDI